MFRSIVVFIAVTLFACNAWGQIGYTAEGNASYYADRFHGKRTSSGEVYNMHAFTAAHRELPFGSLVKVTNLENDLSVIVRVNDRGPFKSNRILDLSLSGATQIDMVRNGIARVRIEVVGIKEEIVKEIAKPVAEAKPKATPSKPVKGKAIEKKPATAPRPGVKKPEASKPPPTAPGTENKSEKVAERTTTRQPGFPAEASDARPSGAFPYAPFKSKGTYNLLGEIVKYESYCVQIGVFGELDKAKQLAARVRTGGYSRVYIQVLPQGKGITEYKVVLGVYDTKEIARMNLPEIQRKGFTGFVSRHI